MPRVLHFYEFFPFWKTFVEELGFEAIPSPPSTGKMIREGIEVVSADACFPVKIAHGHILSLSHEGLDALLLPSLISFPRNGDKEEKNVTCPYSQAIPYLARATMGERMAETRILQPIVDFQKGRHHVHDALLGLGRELGASKTAASRAFRAAEEAQQLFARQLRARGDEVIRSLRESGRRALVLVGRTYNTCDGGVNLNLPRKIKDLGWVAFPMDFLPLSSPSGKEMVPNMYWRTGQRIMAAVQFLRGRNDLLPIYLTNFGCGPDSFISHFFKEKMAGHPFLQIEVDEHSADAGALTRIEAFLDSIPPAEETRPSTAPVCSAAPGTSSTGQGRTLLLPRMSDHAVALAGAFLAVGQEAEVLPESDESSILLGRRHTSGKECYPCIVTTGDIVRKTAEPGFDPDRSAFFMPTGDGPCRFGQYRAHLDRVLKQLDFDSIPILSLSAENSYEGMGADFQRLAWEGILAVDMLDKLRRRFRPYADNPAEVERIYAKSLVRIKNSLAARKDLMPILLEAAGELSALPARDEERPLIGVVGEIFLRSNDFSNEDLVRKIERFGGEVLLAPVSEWILYTNFTSKRRILEQRQYAEFAREWLKDRYQRRREKKYVDAIGSILGNGHEPTVEKLLDLSLPYLHHSFEGEAVLTIGKSIEMAGKGIAGVVSAMPFTCMPGTISAAISKKVREDCHSLPFLNMVYDGQGGVGAEVRLEAFIHQARAYSRRQGVSRATRV